ncbi:MAG TPA: hypothetical protein VHF88_08455 [Thermoleophilaceae bacterium]|nr:hypothetical protein [Thermoleophilaceae bacterium]
MSAAGRDGGRDPAARARQALERGASSLGAQLARAASERWQRLPEPRRAKLETLAANVRERALEKRAEPARDVSEIEVRDLRAELARELDRIAGADIAASRGTGELAGEPQSGEGRHRPPPV